MSGKHFCRKTSTCHQQHLFYCLLKETMRRMHPHTYTCMLMFEYLQTDTHTHTTPIGRLKTNSVPPSHTSSKLKLFREAIEVSLYVCVCIRLIVVIQLVRLAILSYLFAQVVFCFSLRFYCSVGITSLPFEVQSILI